MSPLHMVQGLVLFAVLFCCASLPLGALGQSCALGPFAPPKKAEKKPLSLKEACRVLLKDHEIPKTSKLGKRLVAADLDYSNVAKTYWVYGALDIDLRRRRYRIHFPAPAGNRKVQPWIDGVFYYEKGQWKA